MTAVMYVFIKYSYNVAYLHASDVHFCEEYSIKCYQFFNLYVRKTVKWC